MNDNIVFGAVLIPNKKIYRQANMKILEPHYIYFNEETIEKLRNNFHEKNYENNITINHNGEIVNGVTMIESFIINDENKKNLPNQFEDLPNGTWMAKYKIENETIWQMVNEKKLNGFSIEGFFDFEYES